MADAIDWKRVIGVWRASGRSPQTIVVYTYWAQHYFRHCVAAGRPAFACLTRAEAAKYSGAEIPVRRRRRIRKLPASPFLPAIRALSCALLALGHRLPPWQGARSTPRLPPLVRAFVNYRLRHHGVAPSSKRGDVRLAIAFLGWLRRKKRRWAAIRVVDVDEFVTDSAQRWAPKTVAGMCSVLRAFLRYLHATGRVPIDLAWCVMGPRMRLHDRPPRAIAWSQVRRIVRAIDVRSRIGRRDFAMFLMMAGYGMGAGEVLGLRLDDIDWVHKTIRVRRPKTGTVTILPLLAPIAHALARYLRDGRPRHAHGRAVFVSHKMPHEALSGSGAINHRLAEHAATAGVAAEFLGSHVFRHTHATRQIESGVTPKVVGDILGHRRPDSTSHYVRGAIFKLRAVALPVPL